MDAFYESRAHANAVMGQEHFQDTEARARSREERDKQLNLDKSIKLLYEVTGLTKNEFLFEFYQRKLAELGRGDYEYENDKLRAYTGLMGLVMDRFFAVDLPIPERLRRVFLPDVYSLAGEIYPWKEVDANAWDKEFDRYVTDWTGLKSGRRKTQINSYSGKREELFFDETWSLRLELGKELAALYLDRLKELLSLDKKATTSQILKRNLDLKDLVLEASRYPNQLSSIMHLEIKDECEKLEGDDPLSKLCATSVVNSLYGYEFDLDAFQEQVIQILWTDLINLQKNDEQRQMVELIRREISGEVYDGITEEVV